MLRTSWTREEEQLLCQMIERGLSTTIIATKLNRTRDSVYFKIRRLKLKFLSAVDEKSKKFSAKVSETIEPKELITHEHVLKILSAALQRLQESGLDKEEVKRLKTLSVLASYYDKMLERFERWDEIEKRIEAIEARLQEVASQKQT